MLRVLLLSTGIIAPLAFADVVLVYHSQQGDDPPTEQRLMIADGMIAIYGDLDIDRPTVVYDQSRSAFIFVNHGDRQYTVISEEWMKEASERYKAASKRMEEQIAHLDKLAALGRLSSSIAWSKTNRL